MTFEGPSNTSEPHLGDERGCGNRRPKTRTQGIEKDKHITTQHGARKHSAARRVVLILAALGESVGENERLIFTAPLLRS